MRVEVRRLSVEGRPIPKSHLQKEPVCRGILSIVENRIHLFGRVVRCARLTSASDPTSGDLLPELIDADLLWLLDGVMRLRGNEEVNGAFFGQTWDIRMIGC